jgi:glycosyltransferase involved in cell wall biosynthesis
VSPQFLFPMDAGGKIRTANLLRQLRGGAFETTLLAPASAEEESRWRAPLGALADAVRCWRPTAAPPLRRAIGLAGSTPVSALNESSAEARAALRSALAAAPDLIVFDYAQSAASAPAPPRVPHVLFAHNVETEILERHAARAAGLARLVWRREAAKMRRFERRVAARADAVIAVSDRDAERFRAEFGARRAVAIPTGVDCDYFAFAPPPDAPTVAFTGSLDWKANVDGLYWFMDEVWPAIARRRSDARFIAIGKNPPRALVQAAKARSLNWRFTGFVDDVRPHARAAAFVIPLKVGGGTRIKAFEAMAMGTPVVSTAIGVEGLAVAPGVHFLLADAPNDFAQAVLRLLDEAPLRRRLAQAARRLVEDKFGHAAAARAFERACLDALRR